MSACWRSRRRNGNRSRCAFQPIGNRGGSCCETRRRAGRVCQDDCRWCAKRRGHQSRGGRPNRSARTCRRGPGRQSRSAPSDEDSRSRSRRKCLMRTCRRGSRRHQSVSGRSRGSTCSATRDGKRSRYARGQWQPCCVRQNQRRWSRPVEQGRACPQLVTQNAPKLGG